MKAEKVVETISKGSIVVTIEMVVAMMEVIVMVTVARGGVNVPPMANQDMKTGVDARIHRTPRASFVSPSGS